MIIKTINKSEVVPSFYAPFYIDYMRNGSAKCTLIGLNILFYFAVEFYFSLIKMCSVCTPRRFDFRIIDE